MLAQASIDGNAQSAVFVRQNRKLWIQRNAAIRQRRWVQQNAYDFLHLEPEHRTLCELTNVTGPTTRRFHFPEAWGR